MKNIKDKIKFLINITTRYHVVEWLPCSKLLHGDCKWRALLSNGQEARVYLINNDLTINYIK